MIEKDNQITRGLGKQRVINETNGVFTVGSNQSITRSGKTQEDTLLYVFNFNDNRGFAVVSSNRNTEGLLAVVESGFYRPDKETNNPGFNMFMKMAKLYVQSSTKSLPITRGVSYKYRKGVNDTLEYYRIEPKVQIKWGAFNTSATYCWNGCAGCAPIAAVQIMSYYQRPSSFVYTFNGRDKEYEFVDWNLINQHTYTYQHDTEFCNTYPNVDRMVGRICRQLGEKSNSTYMSNYVTQTSASDLLSAINYYGYSTSGFHDIPNDDTAFLNYLQENKLILMIGRTRSGKAHTWIVDGGSFEKIHCMSYVSQDAINWELNWEQTNTFSYNHVNWGWDGDYNGFFVHSVFDANSCLKYDVGSYNNSLEDLYYYKNLKYTTVY
jgi:hypothetical protein